MLLLLTELSDSIINKAVFITCFLNPPSRGKKLKFTRRGRQALLRIDKTILCTCSVTWEAG